MFLTDWIACYLHTVGHPFWHHVMQESRVKRALERAAAPVFKKTGKPVMFRSQPPRRKTVQVLDENKDDDSELQQFLA